METHNNESGSQCDNTVATTQMKNLQLALESNLQRHFIGRAMSAQSSLDLIWLFVILKKSEKETKAAKEFMQCLLMIAV